MAGCVSVGVFAVIWLSLRMFCCLEVFFLLKMSINNLSRTSRFFHTFIYIRFFVLYRATMFFAALIRFLLVFSVKGGSAIYTSGTGKFQRNI